jgi:hypothetical protein
MRQVRRITAEPAELGCDVGFLDVAMQSCLVPGAGKGSVCVPPPVLLFWSPGDKEFSEPLTLLSLGCAVSLANEVP